MKKTLPLLALTAALACPGVLSAQEAKTVPVGVVTISVAAGNGSAKAKTAISIPLLGSESIQGAASGRITGVTANSISSSGAGWLAGAFSGSSAPFVIRVTSGQAVGSTFLISSQTPNTDSTVTIDAGDASFVNLTSLGIQTGSTTGDTFEIIPCDTISSLFGTPATTGVLGGTSANTADTLVISNTQGVAQTFYFNTSLNRWARQALGNPDASSVPIRPDSGIVYFRLANTPLTFVVTGEVPSTDRKALVKNSGVTYLANSWPVSRTLSQMGFQNLPGWASGSSVATADVVTVGASNYFFDGTNWRRQALGSPISDPTIEVGTAVTVNRKGSASSANFVAQSLPYNLN